MAKIILRGWSPDSERRLIPLVKALRANLGCSLPEAVEMAEQCTSLSQVVTRVDIPFASATSLLQQLRALDFDITLEE